MRLLCWLRDHPIVILGVILAGLGAWIASDLTYSPQKPAPGVPTGVVQLAQMTMDMPDHKVNQRTAPAVPVDKIPKLKPGMSRADVVRVMKDDSAEIPGGVVANPYKVKSVEKGGASYEILYYVTQQPTARQDAMTSPVILKGGVVTGLGMDALRTLK